jgi:hypothetical protein
MNPLTGPWLLQKEVRCSNSHDHTLSLTSCWLEVDAQTKGSDKKGLTKQLLPYAHAVPASVTLPAQQQRDTHSQNNAAMTSASKRVTVQTFKWGFEKLKRNARAQLRTLTALRSMQQLLFWVQPQLIASQDISNRS